MTDNSIGKMTETMTNIDLGFPVQPLHFCKLNSKYFPSKIGGKPAWLSLKSIPSDQLKCTSCQEPLLFLLQIYAPFQHIDEAFHRTIFVFCCRKEKCNQFKAFRSQLPRVNQFYSSEPPNYDDLNDDDDDDDNDLDYDQFGVKLCSVCGCPAPKACGKCKNVNYCSKKHQKIDWNEGNHKMNCGKESNKKQILKTRFISALFPEYEIEIESISEGENNSENSDSSDDETEKMKDLNECINKLKPKYQNEKLKDFDEEESEEQKVFQEFISQCKNDKDQVIRYYRNNDASIDIDPLWTTSKNKPSMIPNCENCGSKRKFEFQIMPQLLRLILNDEDELDWGIIAVYTCSASCSIQNIGYKHEFIWKQSLT